MVWNIVGHSGHQDDRLIIDLDPDMRDLRVFADGRGGDDVIVIDGPRGLSTADVLFGREGDDLLSAGAGNDLLFGGSGDDVLRGGSGMDRLYGEAGADVLWSGGGADLLDGGGGDDRLIAQGRSATLVGGDGSDSFEIGERGGFFLVRDLDLDADAGQRAVAGADSLTLGPLGPITSADALRAVLADAIDGARAAILGLGDATGDEGLQIWMLVGSADAPSIVSLEGWIGLLQPVPGATETFALPMVDEPLKVRHDPAEVIGDWARAGLISSEVLDTWLGRAIDAQLVG
jgi:Ca2+-binding RTX toxin-like protein